MIKLNLLFNVLFDDAYQHNYFRMGQTTSTPFDGTTRFSASDIYMPINETRMNSERNQLHVDSSLNIVESKTSMIKSAFSGIWSVRIPESVAPLPRSGHFYIYDEENALAYIGYGIDPDHQPMNDIWVLNTISRGWSLLKLRGDNISGRSGSRALLFEGYIYVFGGYNAPDYYSDLHKINLQTGEVSLIQTTGEAPSPRSSPIFTVYGRNFYVWGGFNGEWPTDLHVLNVDTLEWIGRPQQVAGRICSPGAQRGNKYFVYGASKSGGMLILDLDTLEMSQEQCTGSLPPSGVLGSGMILVEHYLFFFGGKASSNWTLMYVCDVDKLWWFIFHIQPDGITVSTTDGNVNDLGLFMLPRIHSFGVCYVKQKREIMAFLGEPLKDPPPLFIVEIGDALSIIHLREDMVDILRNSFPQ